MRQGHWMTLIFSALVVTGCCPCLPVETRAADVTFDPFMVEDGLHARILMAEDRREETALLELIRHLSPGMTAGAVRMSHASGRIPSLSAWRELHRRFGHREDVRRALLYAIRYAEPPFPPTAVLPVLKTFPANRDLCETLFYLDSPEALSLALSMSQYQDTAAANLWRLQKRIDPVILRDAYRRFPGQAVLSIVRLREHGIVTADDLEDLDWQTRAQGVVVCDDPLRFIDDPVWQVRAAALHRDIPPDRVRPLLHDDSPLVREAALGSYLRCGGDPQSLHLNMLTAMGCETLLESTDDAALAESVFTRGGIFSEVALPYLPEARKAFVLASSFPDHAKISFLERRLGLPRAVAWAADRFEESHSAAALSFLLNQDEVAKESLILRAGQIEGLRSILYDHGHLESAPRPAADSLDGYRQILSRLRDYRGFKIMTEKGVVSCRFNRRWAPLTCWNMIDLIGRNHFDGCRFHRVIAGFVTQGGDPTGTGSGGPGYRIRCELNPLRYDRPGVVGMALAGKDTGGSQFFITHAPAPHLNHKYTVFAEVISGLDVLFTLLKHDLIVDVSLW